MSLTPHRRKVLETHIFAEVMVALMNLFLAHRARSVTEAILAVVIWLVLAPVFSLWWVRNMVSDKDESD
jgi:hypothetical protein